MRSKKEDLFSFSETDAALSVLVVVLISGRFEFSESLKNLTILFELLENLPAESPKCLIGGFLKRKKNYFILQLKEFIT